MPQQKEDSPTLFSESPEWADVTPIEQYENMNPIAQIYYTPECESRSVCAENAL